ncbi:MAG: hypothetical protein V4646_07170 [Pseudomonadota bacterium]
MGRHLGRLKSRFVAGTRGKLFQPVSQRCEQIIFNREHYPILRLRHWPTGHPPCERSRYMLEFHAELTSHPLTFPHYLEPLMKKLLSLIAVAFAFSMTLAPVAHAADAKADCAAQSAEKKLAGAAKNSFEKKCMADAGAASPAAACAAQSAEKKLAGAAKNSFEKKCIADASGEKKAEAPSPAAACAAQSAEKKLAGAAKSSFEKKCIADASGDKKVADAKPAAKADAKPVSDKKADAKK